MNAERPAERHFVCAKCDGVFLTERPDPEALVEYKATFPRHVNAPKVELCQDCYIGFLTWLHKHDQITEH